MTNLYLNSIKKFLGIKDNKDTEQKPKTIDDIVQIKDKILEKYRQRGHQRETDDSLIVTYTTRCCHYTGMMHSTGMRPSRRYEINKKSGNVIVTHYIQAEHYLPPSPATLLLMPYEPSSRTEYTPKEFLKYLRTKDRSLGKKLKIPFEETLKGKIEKREIEFRRILRECKEKEEEKKEQDKKRKQQDDEDIIL